MTKSNNTESWSTNKHAFMYVCLIHKERQLLTSQNLFRLHEYFPGIVFFGLYATANRQRNSTSLKITITKIWRNDAAEIEMDLWKILWCVLHLEIVDITTCYENQKFYGLPKARNIMYIWCMEMMRLSFQHNMCILAQKSTYLFHVLKYTKLYS